MGLGQDLVACLTKARSGPSDLTLRVTRTSPGAVPSLAIDLADFKFRLNIVTATRAPERRGRVALNLQQRAA